MSFNFPLQLKLMVDKQGALPEQIHAEKSFVTICTLSAPHCFISNAHLMLICAHFCAPQPCWFAQHNCISVGNLLNLYVCTLFTRGKKTQGEKLLSNGTFTKEQSQCGKIEGWRAITSCLCHLPQPSPLQHSLWQENTPPPGLHHKACQRFSQR